MTYRDDREALQARVEALESELATQKNHYEQELDALRVGATPPSRRKARLLLFGGIAAAVVLLGGVAAGLLASSSSRSDEPVVEMVPAPPAPKDDYVPMRTEAHREPTVRIDTARGVAHVHDGAMNVEVRMDAESEGPLDPGKPSPRWVRDGGAH